VSVVFCIELEREEDGRWIAEVVELPGALAYGTTQDEAIARAQALTLRVVADQLEHDEAGREYLNISFAVLVIKSTMLYPRLRHVVQSRTLGADTPPRFLVKGRRPASPGGRLPGAVRARRHEWSSLP
jgi:predicted RNase H-like HicB family nuclease